MFRIFANLGENFAAILALIFLFSTFAKSVHRDRFLVASLLNGALFSLVAVFAMSHPIWISEGIAIDARVVLVALSGVFGGPGAAAVAALVVSAYRGSLGGIGTLPGVVVIQLAAFIGTRFPWQRIQESGKPLRHWWGLGFALAATGLAGTLLLPWPVARQALQGFALPVAVLFPVATVVFGTLFGRELARQATVQKLLRNEAMLRTISDNFQEGMIYQVVLMPDGQRRFTYLSDSVRALYGITPAQAMEDPNLLYRRIHEDDIARMREDEERARRTLSTFKTEVRIHDPSGAIRWSSFASRPELQPDGSITWDGIEFIITERKLAEEERRRLDERMGNAQKLEALGVLVAGVAHNINNVLAAIMGTASLQGAKTADPADHKAFDIVVNACRRGRDVVRSLMQFARPTLSDEGPVDLLALLSEVRLLLENTTLNRVAVVEEFPAESVWIHGDAGSISHCFMNLCINSLDAMPDGGTIRIRVETAPSGHVEVRIVDTGEGMAPETLARVFEPFFTTKPVGKGTGLGMSMTHGVIKAHGGSMEVESVLGSGTVVKVRLPRIASPVPPAEPVAAHGAKAHRKVLLVDDDEDVRFLVARMLKAKGLEVESVGDGKSALERLRDGALPDLVILDQNMPGMDGIETMERIRAMGIDLPILISSGQPDILEWECFRKPNIAILSKPFDLEELDAKLAEIGA